MAFGLGRHRTAKVVIAVLVFLISGCGVISPVDRTGIQKAFLEERPKLDHAALLSFKSYNSQCPQAGVGSAIACYTVPIPNRPKNYVGTYLIETNPAKKTQTIAFRGTDNLSDGWTDAMTRKDHDQILDIDDHSGFRIISQILYADIINNHRLRAGYSVVLTGHSLGGAIALLVALYLNYQLPTYNVAGVYTFGQPKVFDNSAVSAWTTSGTSFASKVTRVVNCDDPVPLVPTDEDWFGNIVQVRLFSSYRLTDFQHIGRSVILFDDGQYWMTLGVDLERKLDRTAGDLIVSKIKNEPIDHSMSQYLVRMDAIPSDASTVLWNPPDKNHFPCTRGAPLAKLSMLSDERIFAWW